MKHIKVSLERIKELIKIIKKIEKKSWFETRTSNETPTFLGMMSNTQALSKI
jgi:hypothetical protein